MKAKKLEADLRKSIKGEVRFDDGSRALYATDSSNYRQVPIGVVIPRDTEDIIQSVAVAREHGAPILARGGGTSLAGQCCNIAVVMDLSKYYNNILNIDPQQKTADIEPGVVLDTLRNAAEQHHLTYGPDPATHNHCTLGGMIGNNSCGVHSVYSGKTDENVEELEILTYRGLRIRVGKTNEEELAQIIQQGGERGEIYSRLKALREKYADLIRQKFPDIPRRVSGYNLPYLLPENGFHVARALVGSECTCVVVINAKVRLVHSPPKRTLLVLGFRNIAAAGDRLMDILKHKPLALEGIDDRLVHFMKKKHLHPQNIALLPEGEGWLFVEFGGESEAEAEEHAMNLMNEFGKRADAPCMKLFKDPAEAKMVWKVRESALGATAFVPGEAVTWEGWEDSAVPPEKVGSYLRDFRSLLDKHGYACSLYGHFGQGCIHTRIDFDLQTHPGIQKYRAFVEEAADLVVSYGGSLSGEHGDGQSRAELLPKMFGPELIEAFREFKSIWDPDNKMNPGKLVDAYRLDENLRLGVTYNPPQPETNFKYPDDRGSFANATLRCVGVGECRRLSGGIMCPSYRATMEEKHSTRGRAHLLFEMMQGEVLKERWRSDAVKDALDLCLACKGCKHECPVEVDVATYKAEFLSHYYEDRLRPRTAYSMGLIHRWARVGSVAPTLVNLITQNSLFGWFAKMIGGIATERKIPPFAKENFRKWFCERKKADETSALRHPKVILWPDTFNSYFRPNTARAAVEVLEAAGFNVHIPEPVLCCGRPLYDFGMLDRAKKLLEEILVAMKSDIEAGTPVIGLEPSCTAVFRDELTHLFPANQDALRLAQQTFLFSEFVERNHDKFQVPELKRRAIVHGHCHHRSVIGFDAEEAVLKSLGLDLQILDSGCCGMAGSFGFEKDHYEISMKIGEHVLLPAVRAADDNALILANGFSCREQIEQSTGRQTLHLAEVMQMVIAR